MNPLNRLYQIIKMSSQPLLLGKVLQAAKVATQSHGTQTRQFSRLPYIIHPTRVAALVVEYYGNLINIEDLLQVAYLHDVLEDTSTTEEELRTMFSKQVVDMVVALTNDPVKKGWFASKGEYLTDKIMNHMTIDEVRVKFCDRLDNLIDWLDTMYMSSEAVQKAKAYSTQTKQMFVELQTKYKEPIMEDILKICQKIDNYVEPEPKKIE